MQRMLVENLRELGRRMYRSDFTIMAYEGVASTVTFFTVVAFLFIGALEVLAHNLTIGGYLRRHAVDILSQQNPRGTFAFTGAATGSDFADFLLGIPSTSSIAFGNADKYLRGFCADCGTPLTFEPDDSGLVTLEARCGLSVGEARTKPIMQPVSEVA